MRRKSHTIIVLFTAALLIISSSSFICAQSSVTNLKPGYISRIFASLIDAACSHKEIQVVVSVPEPDPVWPDPAQPMVALTFDDGPYSPVTDRIVAKLKEYNGHGTFFVVGNRVSSYSASVTAAFEAGCQIGNHTWDHTTLTKLSSIEIQRQLRDTDNIVSYYTGIAPTVMRPVGGTHNAVVDSAVGKPMINWSIDTLDWKTKNAKSVENSVLNNIQDGDIVLMHDLYKSTADACDIIIPELSARGYQLVTVNELAAARGATLECGTTYRYLRP